MESDARLHGGPPFRDGSDPVHSSSFTSAWRWMLVTKLAIWIAILAYKTQNYPRWQYEHLLVDYHFGFTKRALIGALASFVFPKVPLWAVYAIGGAAWLVTLALFVMVFRRAFGFSNRNLPLLVFMGGSPFFFANFMQNIGYSDIYGCAFALVLLLLPARRFVYVIAAATGAMLLILIHHIQILLYVPTIAAIVVSRYYLLQRRSFTLMIAGAALLMLVATLFLAAQFAGSPPVPIAAFEAHMRSRMAGPNLPVIDGNMWYQALADELSGTTALLTKNLLRVPIYALVLAAHWPLMLFFRRLVMSREAALHRQLAWCGVALITLAYLTICVVAFDYSRWISNWAVCMMVLIFAIKSLPEAHVADPIPDGCQTRRWGWVITAIPRIGTTIPF